MWVRAGPNRIRALLAGRWVQACTLAASLSVALPSSASQVGDAELIVERGPGALACPDAPGLEDAIERVGAVPEGERPSGDLELHVQIVRTDQGYRAVIRASGRKSGVRTLDLPGPSCDALTEAVAVTLAILMDREIREPEPDEPPTPPTPPEQPEEPSPEEPASPEPTSEPAEPPAPSAPPPSHAAAPTASHTDLGLMLGSHATHGLPEGWSGLILGGAYVRTEALDVSLSGFWAPSRTVEYVSGYVDVRLLGLRLSGCGRLVGSWSAVHMAGCAEGAFAQLQGEGHGFATDRVQRRPFYALGGSVRIGGPLLGAAQWTVTVGLLAPLQSESFSVDRIGTAYESDAITFFAGPQVFVPIL